MVRLIQPRLLRWRQVVAIIVAIHAVCVGLLFFLEVNNAPELYFPKNAPATVLDNSLRAEFPNDEFLIGLFEGDHLYGEQALAALARVASRLGRHSDVERVFAVTQVEHLASSADGFSVEQLIDVSRLSRESEKSRIDRVLGDRFMPGWLATRDGRGLAMVVRARKLSESRQRQSIEAEFRQAVSAEGLEDRLTAVAGTVVLDAAEMRSMLRDTVIFTPIVFAMGLGLLYWVVGRRAPVVIGAVAMSTVVVFCVAMMAALRLPYTLVTAMLPTLLSAYTVSTLLHLYAALKRMRDAGFRRPMRVEFALQSVHVPAIFNVVSTAAGLVSLVLVPIPPIQVFGVIGAIGTLVIYLVVFYLVPPLLVKFDRGRWPKVGSGFRWTKTISYGLASFGIRYAGWVVAGAFALVVASVPLVLRVEVESDLLKFFDEAHPLSVSTSRVERSLVGVTALEVVIDGPGRDAFKEANRLKAIKAFQDNVEALPEVDRAFSMLDIVEEMHWAFNDEDIAFRRLPDDDRVLSQLLLIYDGRDLHEVVNREFQRMRILLNVNVHGANAIQGVMEKVEELAEKVQNPDLRWQIGGYGRLFADQEDLLVVGQVNSFLGAFGQIFLIMLLLWRSIPKAVISMVPNLAPLFFVFALMGAARIHLDMATVLIAGVVLGITVDDTIHLFHNYLHRRHCGYGVVFSLARSFEASGRAVVAISILLVSQFMLLGASSFRPTADFGILTATGLLSGQIMELLLLPALLVLWDRRKQAADKS